MRFAGNQKIINFLNKQVEKGKLSQAYLFSGPEHLGKFTLAMEMAEKITGGKGQKINPDIIVIAPEIEEKKGITKKRDIKIESIRELQKKLALEPYFGKFKVAVIDDAERLTIASQNALLKNLEEPDAKTVLILVSHNEEKILPTIKSRCVLKRFNLASENEIAGMLEGGADSEEIIFWSAGRPGTALSLKENKQTLSDKRENLAELKKIISGNLNEKFAIAEILSKNTEELLEKMNLWLMILRQNIFSGGKPLGLSSVKSLKLLEQTEKTKKLIQETNSNARLALESLFLDF